MELPFPYSLFHFHNAKFDPFGKAVCSGLPAQATPVRADLVPIQGDVTFPRQWNLFLERCRGVVPALPRCRARTCSLALSPDNGVTVLLP